MEEKRLTFDNIREMLLELYNNAKDTQKHNFYSNKRHTCDSYGVETLFFENNYSDALTGEQRDDVVDCFARTGVILNDNNECFEASWYTRRRKYEISIFVKLTNGWILNVYLISNRKKDIMHRSGQPDEKGTRRFCELMKDIRHPGVRKLIYQIYNNILASEMTNNGGNGNGREEDIYPEGRDEELRSSLYN